MIVVGFDPSVTAFGWAVFETEPVPMLKNAGVWETWADRAIKGAGADNQERFEFVAQQLWEMANQVKPERIFVEGLVFMTQTNFAALSTSGRARGLVDMLGAVLNVQIIELSPQAVKKGLGIVRTRAAKEETGMASKGEVAAAVMKLYPNAGELLPRVRGKPDEVTKAGTGIADAIAVVHSGLARVSFEDRLKSGVIR